MTETFVLVMTDVVDSTRITEQLGDAAFASLWAEHDRAARALLREGGGREIDKSDGLATLFPSVVSALAFTQRYHRALAALPVPLRARAAVHVGPLALRENAPEDVARGAKPFEADGLARPIAARLMSLAAAGQTLLTEAAAQMLEPVAGWRIVSHGFWRLKGIEAPVEVFEAGDASTAFAPPSDAAKAYRVLRDGELWRPLHSVRHTLPAERDAFVGRGADLRALAERLEAPARLVTVVGPGGTGKTRLATRFGWVWLGDWTGGVWFCDLSEAASRDGVLGAVAVALGVPLGADDAAAQLGHAIAGRGRCLVILDNFEQVVEHAASTLGVWLDRAAEASFLVTSRERLNLPGEVLLPLAPLPVAREAVDLFALRAAAQQPVFSVSDANRADVERIVALLDGLPLAIELAAARVRVLSPAQLLERLKARFQLLAGARGGAPRQATLRAAIDWSWQLLMPWEQAAFAHCSVFEGGFTLDAAEAVLDLTPWPEAPAALDVVQSLVDKSLLRRHAGGAAAERLNVDEPYFGMYLSLHEYAAEKLAAMGSEVRQAAFVRHGRWFAALGGAQPLQALDLRDGARRRRRLARELDNLVAACRRAIERADAPVAVDTYRAVYAVVASQGPLTLIDTLSLQLASLASQSTLDAAHQADVIELRAGADLLLGRMEAGEAGLRQALSMQRAARRRLRQADLLAALGRALRVQGRMTQAQALLEEALAITRADGTADDVAREAGLIGELGQVHGDSGRVEPARLHFEQALASYRSAGHRGSGRLCMLLGVLEAEQGRFDKARGQFEDAVAIAREWGDRSAEGFALVNLGCLHQDQGRLDDAERCFEAGLAIHGEVGNRRWQAYVLGDLGRLQMQRGAAAAAERHLVESLTILRELRDRRIEGSELRSLGDLYLGQGRHAEAGTCYAQAEEVLRAVGDRLYLGYVLCGRGELSVAMGDPAPAAELLRAAEVCARELLVNEQSELGRRIAHLRERLSASPARG